MGATTKIEWCDHTLNIWRGCTRVSEGCRNCYAETMSARNHKVLGTWGPQGQRVVAAESYWRQPIKWNKDAEEAGNRRKVFCASLADVFEDWTGPMLGASGERLSNAFDGEYVPTDLKVGRDIVTMQHVRERLFVLIDATPNLDWLLLTKRPENIERMMPAYFPGGYIAEAGRMNQEGPRPNVWLGVSVENQQCADERIPLLLQVPAAVRFLSVEPLLEDLGEIRFGHECNPHTSVFEGYGCSDCMNTGYCGFPDISWVIVGGESGPNFRECEPAWIKSIARQCQAARVPVFVKQDSGPRPGMQGRIPDDVWALKQFPEVK